MTDRCPRCAELEARLANFERETFAELRARVRELETGIREIQLMSVPAGYDPGNSDITKVCKRVLTKSEGGPTANPKSGSYTWVDSDGKAWTRTSEGNVYPHPLFVEKK